MALNDRFDRVCRNPAYGELFAISQRRIVSRGEVLIAEGSYADRLFLLISGLLSVRFSGHGGEEMLLSYLHPGDFFGEMGLFPGANGRSAMIRAAEDCSVLEVGYRPFVELSQRFPELWLELAGQLAERLRTSNRRLSAMPVLHTADRIWMVLVQMASNTTPAGPNQECVIRLSRKDLGKLAGCSRELAGLVLQDMAKEGRLVLRGHSIVISSSAIEPAEGDSGGA